MDKFFDKLTDIGIDSGFKILWFFIILIVGFKIVKIITKIINKDRGFNKFDKSVKSFISSFVTIFLKCIVLITALASIGVPMTSMITLFGTASLAIGLALQGGLTNMVGGLMILIFKPFKVGDIIESNNNSGCVKNITVFYTEITTIDGTKVVLPNGNLANSSIKNFSANDKRKLCIDFSVGYDSDIDKVKKVLNDVITKEELVLQDEEVFIRLTEHSNSALIFTVRVWTLNKDYWNLRFNLLENVKKAFDKNKISIPYPQVDVHLKGGKYE